MLVNKIRAAFTAASEVVFYARPANWVVYRFVTLGDSLVGLQELFEALNIPAKGLRDIFWFGRKVGDGFGALGAMPLRRSYFRRLARMIGKPMKVFREDGGTGEYYYRFTVQPDSTLLLRLADRLDDLVARWWLR